jgi:hypothetical protein
VSDLLESPEREVRHRVLDFLCHLVIGQYAALDIMRAQFFRFLKQHKDKVRHFAGIILQEGTGRGCVNSLKFITEKKPCHCPMVYLLYNADTYF